MKTVTPPKLCLAYRELYPGEISDIADGERIMGNWLDRYTRYPLDSIRTQNWHGKVTTALFKALGLKQPKTKRDMVRILLEE